MSEPDAIRRIRISGRSVDIAALEAGPREGALVVFLHGFPDEAQSWTEQLRALADAGYRAVAPDQRGYGDTGGPTDAEDYEITELCRDVVDVIDHYGAQDAVIVGHDWGGLVAWAFPILHPERCRAVVGVNTPHVHPSRVAPTAVLKARYGADHYMVRFQEPKAHEALDRDPEAFLRLVFHRQRRDPDWPAEPRIYALLERLREDACEDRDLIVAEADLLRRAAIFRRCGFERPVHWYRNIDTNAARFRAQDSVMIHKPCLWVGAAWDQFLHPSFAEKMDALIPSLTKVIIPECGHWTQLEKPGELNAHLVAWLQRLEAAEAA